MGRDSSRSHSFGDEAGSWELKFVAHSTLVLHEPRVVAHGGTWLQSEGGGKASTRGACPKVYILYDKVFNKD